MKRLFIINILSVFFFFEGKTQTCSDGILNQNETSVDCGGVCGNAVNSTIANATFIASDGTCMLNQSNNCVELNIIDICLPTDSIVGVFYTFPLIPYSMAKISVIISNSNFSNNTAVIFLAKKNNLGNPEFLMQRKIENPNDTISFEGDNTYLTSKHLMVY